MEDLDAATLEDVHDFFRQWYRPDNTVLTLCGDVTPQAGMAAAHRYFGELLSPEPTVHRPPIALGPLSEPVRFVRVADVPLDRLTFAFRLPADPAPVVPVSAYYAPVVYSQPYVVPVYSTPVYAAPFYAAPVYAAPYYAGYQSVHGRLHVHRYGGYNYHLRVRGW